jgi:regulator of cell morphogenesis and NO signaling
VKIDISMKLAELVDANPAIAAELERRGLDFCCGGARTLAESCRDAGLDPAQVAADLAAAARARFDVAEWTTMTAPQLVDHLQSTHHRYLWTTLPHITVLLDKIVAVHGGRHAELADVARCFDEIRSDLEPHLLKEERVLFPMIRELAAATTTPSFHCGTLRNPIGVMLGEHDAVGVLLGRLRALTGGYVPPADGCASYRACFSAMRELEADTHLHIHKENNVLFPMVAQLEAALAVASP